MVEVLSQEEIEALLAAMGGEAEEAGPPVIPARPQTEASAAAAATAPQGSGGYAGRAPRTGAASPSWESAAPESGPAARPSGAYQPYDFRRPDKFSKDQMRTLQMLHETFARQCASSLSASLRTNVQLELLSVEQIPYEEYLRSLTGSPLIGIFSMPPLVGQALVEADVNIFFAMMDRLLGGPGQVVVRRSGLTDIEKALLASQVIRRALHELKNAWETIVPIDPQLDTVETSAQFVQIVPPNDTVVLLLFQLKVGDLTGSMTLCLPYVTLKPVAGKLSAQRWLASTAKKVGDPSNASHLARRIQTTRVPCVARLGTAKITVADLLRLAPGDTVVTDTPYGGDVDILVGNNVKFRGQAGTRRRKMVVRIQSIVEQNPEDEDPLAPWR